MVLQTSEKQLAGSCVPAFLAIYCFTGKFAWASITYFTYVVCQHAYYTHPAGCFACAIASATVVAILVGLESALFVCLCV